MIEFFSKNKQLFAPPTKWISWNVSLAESKNFGNTAELISQLKEYAKIPHEQNVWDRDKIDELVKATTTRKWTAYSYHGSAALSFSAAAIFVVFSFKKEELLKYNSRIITLIVGALVLAGTFALMRKHYPLKDKRNTHFADYLSGNLSQEQKTKVIEYLGSLKIIAQPIFSVGNQERFFKIFPKFWATENWLLLFTSNEKHRSAICLNRSAPSGYTYVDKIAKLSLIISGTEEKNEPEEVKLLSDPRVIYTDKNELKKANDYIEENCDPSYIDKIHKLTRERIAWAKALRMFFEHYETYIPYFENTLTTKERDAFMENFYPIFASIAKRTSSNDKAKDINLGYKGTAKFLKQRHVSICNWLGEFPICD